MRAKLLVTTTALIGAAGLMAAPAKVDNENWSFGLGTGGNLGTTTTQSPDPGSALNSLTINLTANGPGAPDLFRKELAATRTEGGSRTIRRAKTRSLLAVSSSSIWRI